jgi:hypothetical protein
MMTSNEKRITNLTKRFPVLLAVPESERIYVALKARRHYSVWGTGLILIVIWLAIFGWDIIALTGHTKGKIDLLVKLFFPAIVPSMIIAGSVLYMQGLAIKHIVRENYASPPR